MPTANPNCDKNVLDTNVSTTNKSICKNKNKIVRLMRDSIISEVNIVISLHHDSNSQNNRIYTGALFDSGYNASALCRKSYLDLLLERYPILSNAWKVEKCNRSLSTANNTIIYVKEIVHMVIGLGDFDMRIQTNVVENLSDDLILGCSVLGLLMSQGCSIEMYHKTSHSKNCIDKKNNCGNEKCSNTGYISINQKTDDSEKSSELKMPS